MDFTQHTSECENAAYGEFLIHAIAAPLGLPNDPKSIDRAVYRGTDCGAWVRFDAKGIVVGTIVENSDAEFSHRVDVSGIEMAAAGEAELNRRFWAAVQRCEDFSDAVWAEMDAAANATRAHDGARTRRVRRRNAAARGPCAALFPPNTDG